MYDIRDYNSVIEKGITHVILAREPEEINFIKPKHEDKGLQYLIM